MRKRVVQTFFGLVGLLVLLLIGVRFYVGAVNVPLISKEVSSEELASRIRVPDGFSIGLYAEVPNARVLRFTWTGDLLVANPNLGQITLVARDKNGDGQADGQRLLIGQLNGPNGLDFYQDWLYIAEQDAIGRVKFDHINGSLTGDYERIITGLPGGGNHWRKSLRFGPDGLMYVSIGSSCNVCLEVDPRRATMMRYQPDGSGEEIYATGLRNSVGYDWSPEDGQLYATDNGRDMLGDDYPPCELNLIEQGNFYGWPFANGNKEPDPDFGQGKDAEIANSIAPIHDFRAHNAPLGMLFVRGERFPAEYRNVALAALHGSWNRSTRDGYKVVSLHWDADGVVAERDFVSGFLLDGDVIGRPAELAQGPDGGIYIADDFAGRIYRVTYGENQTLVLPVRQMQQQFDPVATLASFNDQERQLRFARGELLFSQYVCVACHNDQPEGKQLDRIGERFDIVGLKAHFSNAPAPMPLFPLTEDDKTSLAVYVISTY